MGMYAETSFEITCENKTSAIKVAQELRKMRKESDKHCNFDFSRIEPSDKPINNVYYVYGQLSSGRVQNLEWQCEQVWERIENIKGVSEVNFPILMETEGLYFSKHEE